MPSHFKRWLLVNGLPEGQTYKVLRAERAGSYLYIRETITQKESKYSYHWQDKKGKLLIRWDNAPHYPKIPTFPHHKHVGTKEKIAASPETTFEEIFAIIAKKLKS